MIAGTHDRGSPSHESLYKAAVLARTLVERQRRIRSPSPCSHQSDVGSRTHISAYGDRRCEGSDAGSEAAVRTSSNYTWLLIPGIRCVLPRRRLLYRFAGLFSGIGVSSPMLSMVLGTHSCFGFLLGSPRRCCRSAADKGELVGLNSPSFRGRFATVPRSPGPMVSSSVLLTGKSSFSLSIS